MSKPNIVHNGVKGKIGKISFQLKQVNGVSHNLSIFMTRNY